MSVDAVAPPAVRDDISERQVCMVETVKCPTLRRQFLGGLRSREEGVATQECRVQTSRPTFPSGGTPSKPAAPSATAPAVRHRRCRSHHWIR